MLFQLPKAWEIYLHDFWKENKEGTWQTFPVVWSTASGATTEKAVVWIIFHLRSNEHPSGDEFRSQEDSYGSSLEGHWHFDTLHDCPLAWTVSLVLSFSKQFPLPILPILQNSLLHLRSPWIKEKPKGFLLKEMSKASPRLLRSISRKMLAVPLALPEPPPCDLKEKREGGRKLTMSLGWFNHSENAYTKAYCAGRPGNVPWILQDCRMV